MAPKKKQSTNGFMVFTFEWKEKYGKHMSLADATSEAGKIWQSMGPHERAPYQERAKQSKMNLNNKVEKLACTGVPFSIMEKEKQDVEYRERKMKRFIETTVRNSEKQNTLETQSYIFIMVNYFTKTLKGGVYIPAEISLAKYSLQEGVYSTYHSFINPGVTIYGHQYEAKHHSETTHLLPLPPNAKGEDNLGKIYNDILSYIYDSEKNEYPPVYTNRDTIPIVESGLDFLKTDCGAKSITIDVYSIQHLFYIMKEATCKMGEVEGPKSFFMSDAYFERDFFEYQTGIACTYHEEIDKSKYCTQSCVTRWGFMFSDYMCRDIAITLIPGRHVPASTNVSVITVSAPSQASTFRDTDSTVGSMYSVVSSRALPESRLYRDDHESLASESLVSARSSGAAYVGLGAIKKPATTPSTQHTKLTRVSRDVMRDNDYEDGELDSEDHNPFSTRSRRMPRQPDTSAFDIDYDDTTLSGRTGNVTAGHGRRTTNLNVTNASISSVGRGRANLFFN